MQVELSKQDIDAIIARMSDVELSEHEEDLHERLCVAAEELEELEALDLDDCAGGACKL